MTQTLLEMAKDLVLAQIEAHRLSPEEMHQALQHTYASLQALKAQEDANGSSAGEVEGASPQINGLRFPCIASILRARSRSQSSTGSSLFQAAKSF